LRLTKTRTKTEIEDVRVQFPNFDEIKLKAEYTTQGKIIFLETNDGPLIAFLRSKGFS